MTNETRLVDYSTADPSPSLIEAKGYVGAMRYIALGSSDKHLTRTEAHQLRADDLVIGLVAEGEANRTTAGRAAGVADAHASLAAANALGCPSHVPIFAAVDFDAEPEQVRGYFLGWVSVLGRRAGDYGGIKITNAHLTGWHWQTAAWSGGQLSPNAHIYQRAGVRDLPDCDQNVVCRPIPLWGGTVAPPGHEATHKPAPTPKPAPAPAPARRLGYHERKGITEERIARRNARKAGHKARASRIGRALRVLLG